MLDRFGNKIVSPLDRLAVCADEQHRQVLADDAELKAALDGITGNLHIAISATPYDDDKPVAGDSFSRQVGDGGG